MSDPEEEEEVLLLPSDQIRQAISNRNRGAHVARREQPFDPDNFGSGFRGVPTVHKGSQYVRPEQTLGDDTRCWCGEVVNHPWPGKENGRKHPKEGNMSTTTQVLNRSNLSAYSRPIQDFILNAVGKDGLDYKIKNNGTLLYPPDGSTAITVFARNSDRQIRSLEQWYRKHVLPSREEPVADKAVIEKLAEKMNDPIEHPMGKRTGDPGAPIRVDYQPAAPVETPVAQDAVVEPPAAVAVVPKAVVESDVEWHQLVKRDKTPSPWWDTDGNGNYRCRACHEEGKSYIKENNIGLGGHVHATHKGGTKAIRDPEAQARGHNTRIRRNKMVRDVALAVQALVEEYDNNSPSGIGIDFGGNSAKVAQLERQVADLVAERDELLARLALMKEAFSNL